MILPIRTETVTSRVPLANYLLIGLNMLAFLALDANLGGAAVASVRKLFTFQSEEPALYEFVTYQFVHGDAWHLFGNLLFLWVFGNSVNGKMGDIPYVLFYLAGGVFAAWGNALVSPEPFRLIGASGSIAAITTAYLVLFPRARVTVVVWFFFIHFFQVSAMVVIGVKIIAWDNLIAPHLGGAGNVAHMAHMAGYVYGFVGALALLLFRALPRDQFDILALWKRWNQRREFTSAMSSPGAKERAQFGSVAKIDGENPEEQTKEDERLDELSEKRRAIIDALETNDLSRATALHEQLLATDAEQCLPERDQLAIARAYYGAGQSVAAAAAFERFVGTYTRSPECGNMRLLLGIIYARDLQQYEVAEKHLVQTLDSLHDESRRNQCSEWLRQVRAALAQPTPESS